MTENNNDLKPGDGGYVAPSLNGSSVQPAEVDVGGGAPVALGDVVAAAHAASGVSVEDWNTMPDADREALIEAEVARLRKANKPAEAAKPQTKAEKKAAAKAAAKTPEDEAEEAVEDSPEVAALRAEFQAMMKSEREALAGFLQEVVKEEVAKLAAAVPQLAGSAAEAFEARLAQVEQRLRNFIH